MSKRAQSRRRQEGWYIASYIQRIDPVSAFKNETAKHKPWAVWENRMLVRASNSEHALKRTMKLLSSVDHNYKNPDGVLLRSKVEGLTSLVRVLELADGGEIEWLDHTGETVVAMKKRLRKKHKLEAFRAPHDWQAEPSGCRQGRDGVGVCNRVSLPRPA